MQNVVLSVWVCLSTLMSRKLHVQTSQIFCTCYLWLWLNLPLTTLQYIMYFRFCAHNWPGKGDASKASDPSRSRTDLIPPLIGLRRMLKMTRQGAAPGAKSDVYGCLVCCANISSCVKLMVTVGCLAMSCRCCYYSVFR